MSRTVTLRLNAVSDASYYPITAILYALEELVDELRKVDGRAQEDSTYQFTHVIKGNGVELLAVFTESSAPLAPNPAATDLEPSS